MSKIDDIVQRLVATIREATGDDEQVVKEQVELIVKNATDDAEKAYQEEVNDVYSELQNKIDKVLEQNDCAMRRFNEANSAYEALSKKKSTCKSVSKKAVEKVVKESVSDYSPVDLSTVEYKFKNTKVVSGSNFRSIDAMINRNIIEFLQSNKDVVVDAIKKNGLAVKESPEKICTLESIVASNEKKMWTEGGNK